jgi:hypothetical protein
MGRLATRTEGGTRLRPREKTTVEQRIRENEIDADEVVYIVSGDGLQKLEKDSTLDPEQEYGVMPGNIPGCSA